MKTTRNVVTFGFVLIALLSPKAVRADSITENISISTSVPILGVGPTSQFAAFNTGLGTLVDMSVVLSGTLDYTGHGLPIDEGASFELQEDPLITKVCASGIVDCIFFPAVGLGLPFSFALPGLTDPTVLSNYSGTGLRDFNIYNFAANLSDHYFFTGSGTVTFDFIPVKAPVPEPSILLLLTSGVLGLTGVTCRKRLLSFI